jgi:hypothetical protein
MTASATVPYVAYAGAGLTGPYAIPFRFLASADLVVIKTTAAGDDVTLTSNTITGAGDDDGGSLSTAVAVAVGETLKIYRATIRSQTAQYVANGPFPAATHERALDKAMLIDQEQDRDIARSVIAPLGEAGHPLPSRASLKGKFLYGDPLTGDLGAAATALTGYPVSSPGAVMISLSTITAIRNFLNVSRATVIVPDDLPEAAISDYAAIMAAKASAVSMITSNTGIPVIQLLARDYIVEQTLDWSDANGVRLQGAGAYDYGAVSTRIIYTGPIGGTLFSANASTIVIGVEVARIEFDGNSRAATAFSMIGVANFFLGDIRIRGATSKQLFTDSSGTFGTGQLATMDHVDISCDGHTNSIAWDVGPGQADQDCYGITGHKLRILHYDGRGLDVGAADTWHFTQTFIQRPSGAGDSIRFRAGPTMGSNVEQSYELTFEGHFCQGPVVLKAGVNPPRGILLLKANAMSGSAFPTFETGTQGTYTDCNGYEYTHYADNSVWHRTSAGRQNLGAVDAGTARLFVSDTVGKYLAFNYPGLAADTGRWGFVGDNAGNYIERTETDAGAAGQTARYLSRAGSVVTAHHHLVNNIEVIKMDAKGLTVIPLVALNYANDATAAAGGVAVGGLYHTAGAVRVRVA